MQVERAAAQKIVVCTKLSKPMLEFSWGLATAIGMDFDFVIGERLDKVVEVTQDDRTTTHVTPFGHDEGHHCNRTHYEMIPKAVARKRKAAARAAARTAKK